MAVAIQGHADVGMAETLLHDLGVNSLGQQQCGAGMPQVMKPDLRESGCFRQFLELEHHAVDMQWPTRPVCEDKVVIFPEGTQTQSLGVLRDPMLLEHRNARPRERNRPLAASRLGMTDLPGAALAMAERSTDRQRSLLKVDIVPFSPSSSPRRTPVSSASRQSAPR